MEFLEDDHRMKSARIINSRFVSISVVQKAYTPSQRDHPFFYFIPPLSFVLWLHRKPLPPKIVVAVLSVLVLPLQGSEKHNPRIGINTSLVSKSVSLETEISVSLPVVTLSS